MLQRLSHDWLRLQGAYRAPCESSGYPRHSRAGGIPATPGTRNTQPSPHHSQSSVFPVFSVFSVLFVAFRQGLSVRLCAGLLHKKSPAVSGRAFLVTAKAEWLTSCRPCHPYRPCRPCRPASAAMRLSLRRFGHHRLGGDHQTGHRSGVLQRGTGDLGRDPGYPSRSCRRIRRCRRCSRSCPCLRTLFRTTDASSPALARSGAAALPCATQRSAYRRPGRGCRP